MHDSRDFLCDKVLPTMTIYKAFYFILESKKKCILLKTFIQTKRLMKRLTVNVKHEITLVKTKNVVKHVSI